MLFGLCVFILVAGAILYFAPMEASIKRLGVGVVVVVTIVVLALWVKQTGVLGRF